VDIGIWALAPIVARFSRKHPKIRVELSLTGRVVDLVAEGFDLAVRAGPLRDSSLIARRIGELQSMAYASPKHIARRGGPKELADLAKHDCVLFRSTSGKAAWELTRTNGTKGAVEVTGRVATDDLSFVREVVLAGAGIGLLPTFLCARAEAAGRLVRVLPDWELNGAVLHLAYPSARFVPQRVIALREYLLVALAKLARERASSAAVATKQKPKSKKAT
jgi:DNA-binding transcriptional LysR family regulator